VILAAGLASLELDQKKQLHVSSQGWSAIANRFEAGRIGRPLSEPSRTGVLDSAVVYFRTETPIGPAYIGLARSSSGPVNADLFIGTP
jgi:hypothetical protein